MSEFTAGRKFFEHLTGFSRFLRNNGFLTGPEETADMFRALEPIDFADETEVRITLRTVLCSSREEQEVFDDLFHRFFRESENDAGLGMAGSGKTMEDQIKSKEGKETETATVHANADSSDESVEISAMQETGGGISDTESDRTFLQAVKESNTESRQNRTVSISLDDINGLAAAARQFTKNVRLKPSRRWRWMSQGRRLDLRRTFRKSLGTGGYPIDPVWTGHPKRDATFVLLCDGSRSMLPHAEMFLQFAYTLINEAGHADLFLFSTRIKRVTRFIQTGGVDTLPTLPGLGAEWGGGTKIGESLASFVRKDGARLLSKHTVVMIYSDGLDTGSTEQLEWAMKQLQFRSHTVIWLNPLAAHDGYEPEARGMKTALPYVDIFSEGHDAASFQRLAQNMATRRRCS